MVGSQGISGDGTNIGDISLSIARIYPAWFLFFVNMDPILGLDPMYTQNNNASKELGFIFGLIHKKSNLLSTRVLFSIYPQCLEGSPDLHHKGWKKIEKNIQYCNNSWMCNHLHQRVTPTYLFSMQKKGMWIMLDNKVKNFECHQPNFNCKICHRNKYISHQ